MFTFTISLWWNLGLCEVNTKNASSKVAVIYAWVQFGSQYDICKGRDYSMNHKYFLLPPGIALRKMYVTQAWRILRSCQPRSNSFADHKLWRANTSLTWTQCLRLECCSLFSFSYPLSIDLEFTIIKAITTTHNKNFKSYAIHEDMTKYDKILYVFSSLLWGYCTVLPLCSH